MPSWIETPLQDAVAALTQIGENAIVADFGRPLDEPAFASVGSRGPSAIGDIADEIYDCESIEDLAELLPRICAGFAVAHCAVLRVRESWIGSYGAKLLSTYPDEWLERYMTRRYFGIDPVVARALHETGAFYWDEVERSDPVTRGFHQASGELGIGPAGVAFSTDDRNGDRFVVTLSLPLGHAGFRRVFGEKLSDFIEIARILVEVFGELTGPAKIERVVLSEDQLRVLRALASGMTAAEAAAVPILYGSFATIETSILRALSATSLIQAVAIAAKRCLLEVVPFFEDDIYRHKAEQIGLPITMCRSS